MGRGILTKLAFLLQKMAEGLNGGDFPRHRGRRVLTLTEMKQLPMASLVESIGRTVAGTLGDLGDAGATLRGRGALWCLDLGPRIRRDEVVASMRKAGVLIGSVDGVIRLLPASTIEPARLQDACRQLAHACRGACT